MARAVTHLPTQTAPIDAQSKGWSIPWDRWFKTLSDFAFDAGRIQTSGAMKFALVGCVLHMEYNGPGAVDAVLPYAPAVPAWFDVFDGTTWTKVQAIEQPNGKFQITLPTGANVHAHGTFLTTI